MKRRDLIKMFIGLPFIGLFSRNNNLRIVEVYRNGQFEVLRQGIRVLSKWNCFRMKVSTVSKYIVGENNTTVFIATQKPEFKNGGWQIQVDNLFDYDANKYLRKV